MENEAQVHIHTRRSDRGMAEPNQGQTILTSGSRHHPSSWQGWGRVLADPGILHVRNWDFEGEMQDKHQALKSLGFVTDCISMDIYAPLFIAILIRFI